MARGTIPVFWAPVKPHPPQDYCSQIFVAKLQYSISGVVGFCSSSEHAGASFGGAAPAKHWPAGDKNNYNEWGPSWDIVAVTWSVTAELLEHQAADALISKFKFPFNMQILRSVDIVNCDQVCNLWHGLCSVYIQIKFIWICVFIAQPLTHS